MVFNFEVVAKVNSQAKYQVGGCLTPEDTDRELFNQVKEAYREILEREEITLQNHLVIKEDCILFADIDIISITNVLKVLSSGLNFTIRSMVDNNCKFVPASCEPLFRMEVHRLFR